MLLQTVHDAPKRYDFLFFFFFFFSLQLLNLILHSSQFLEYLSTFGVAKKQFFKKIIIFVYKMISNIVFFNSSPFGFWNIQRRHLIQRNETKRKIIFKRGNKNVKKPKLLKNLAFLLYAPKNIKIFPMQYGREHTDVVVLYLKILRDTLRQNLKDTK